MLEEIGTTTAAQYAERLGVGDVPTVPSLALGAGEVTLLSMTSAFGAFANRGFLNTPTLIRRVETIDGRVVYEAQPQPRRALSEETAFILTSMMADVIDRGTASPARRAGFTLPAAGKTGTTNDYHDAWFIGYTPKLVAGVWIGYDQPRTIAAKGYAAILAVPLWARFMKSATAGDTSQDFPVPPTLTKVAICRISGKRAGDSCRDVANVTADGTVMTRSTAYPEYFVRGTEPGEECRGHADEGFFDFPVVGTSGADVMPVAAPETPLPGVPREESVPLPPPAPDVPPVPAPPVEPAPPPPPPPPPAPAPPPPSVPPPAIPPPPVEDIPRPPPPPPQDPARPPA
jgi:penicillin-binding protein 1A